ncbi:MAG TPA: alpha/beta hydrolase [Balneolales bacterium]|nr:alpha/beta hydrolase [Balneolales bacterium]
MDQSAELSEEHLLKLGDCKFENHFWGKGKPSILALPGFMQTCHTFGKIGPLLTKEDYPMLSVSLPAHGRTSCENPDLMSIMDLRHVADRLSRLFTVYNLPPVHLLAHSFGARYAITFAVRHPEYVRSLHMIAPGGFYPMEDRLFRLSGHFPVSGLLKWPFIAGLANKITSKTLTPYQVKNGMRLLRILAETYPAINLYDTRTMLQIFKVTQPVHVYWGEDDRLVPVKYAHEVCQHFPNAQKHIITEAGHNLHLTHPEQLADLMLDALSFDG